MERRTRIIDAAVLVGITLLVFGKAVTFDFVGWDDPVYVYGNSLVQDPLSQGLWGFLRTPGMGYPQPVTVLTHHLDYVIGGGQAWPFHLTNLLLHCVNVLLVLSILRRLALSRLVTNTATFLFACHPVVVEPVCWVTGRKDLLATLFVLAGFALFQRLRDSERHRGILTVGFLIALVFALGSKPTGVVLPAHAAMDLLLRRPERARLGWIAVSIGMAFAVVWIVVSSSTQTEVGALAEFTRVQQAGDVTQHLALQIRNYVAPMWLVHDYDMLGFPRPIGSAWGIAGVVALLGLAVVVGLLWRFSRWGLWALVFALIAFAPSSGIMPLSRGPADIYLYLPGVGLGICLGLALEWIGRRTRLRAAMVGVPVAAVLVFSAFVQADNWRDTEHLWGGVREAYPEYPKSWRQYALALAAAGKPREAVAVMEEAFERFDYPPESADILLSMGAGCAAVRDLACATRWYGETVRHFPEEPAAAFRLPTAYNDHPDAEYAAELVTSLATVERMLTELSEGEPSARGGAVQAFFEAYLVSDPIPIPTLGRYADHPRLGGAARALLGLYGLE